jgi:hypothetical protein
VDEFKKYFTDLFAKVANLAKSRKVWALAASLIAIYEGYATGGVTVWQSLQLAIGALGAYSVGVAIEDGGKPSA